MMKSHDSPVIFLFCLSVHRSILRIFHLLLKLLQDRLDLLETFGSLGCPQSLYFWHLLLIIIQIRIDHS